MVRLQPPPWAQAQEEGTGLGLAHVLVWGCVEGLLSGNTAVSPYPRGRRSEAPTGA